jgi:Domain of unknown function (DUF4738)
MCKKIIYSILILMCLTACKKEAGPSKADNSIQQTDTVYENHVATVYGPLTQKKDTLITINGSAYKIERRAVMDTLKKVVYNEAILRGGKAYKSVYNGYDITYSISLSEGSGNKLFSKTFTKSDFEEIIGRDALAKAMVELPHLHGYHPGFKALMFTLDFWIPETDIGDQCFIMISMDGKVMEKSYNNSYGGGGPDGTIEVPANNAFVLTCAKILNTNGKVVDLIDGLKTVAHTKLINDNTILVVYDPAEEGDTKDNARLIDSHGKVLKTFTYKGYYDLLGYVVPSYLEEHTGTYIMLDDRLDNITVIPQGNPLGIFTVPFTTLRETKTNPENEVTFDINTETSEQTFAIDTVTKAIRLVKQQK